MVKNTTASICLAAALCAQMVACVAPEPDVAGEDIGVSSEALVGYPGASIASPIAKTTVFSGLGPENESFGKSVSVNEALTGFRGWEDGDEPCKIEGTFRDVETGAAGTSLSINRCDGQSPGSMRSAVLPEGFFVTEARVCLNNDRDKIKGISVTGNIAYCIAGGVSVSTVADDCTSLSQGGMEYEICGDSVVHQTPCADFEETAYFERTNCAGDNDGPDSDWETIIRCNAGQVVTRVNLGTTNENGDKESFKGIQLECHDLLD